MGEFEKVGRGAWLLGVSSFLVYGFIWGLDRLFKHSWVIFVGMACVGIVYAALAMLWALIAPAIRWWKKGWH